MQPPFERRETLKRIIGIERRGAPINHLEGRPLPDPTRLEDEDFEGWMEKMESGDKPDYWSI